MISADVLLVPSDDNSYHVETVYRENEPVTVSQEGDSLQIKQRQRGGFFLFRWSFGSEAQVKLHVPEKALCSKLTLKITAPADDLVGCGLLVYALRQRHVEA